MSGFCVDVPSLLFHLFFLRGRGGGGGGEGKEEGTKKNWMYVSDMN